MFVGVSNEQPLTICARVGVATVLAHARVTHVAHTYRICMVYDHVYSMFFVQRSSIPSNKMLTKYRLHIRKLWVLNTIIFNLAIRRVPNHSLWTVCFDLFKLSTCSSLLIGRGYSTWFGAQILTQILIQLRIYFFSFAAIKHM